jgi:hypothetical protein
MSDYQLTATDSVTRTADGAEHFERSGRRDR